MKISIYYPVVTNYQIPGPRPLTCSGSGGGGSNRKLELASTEHLEMKVVLTFRSPSLYHHQDLDYFHHFPSSGFVYLKRWRRWWWWHQWPVGAMRRT